MSIVVKKIEAMLQSIADIATPDKSNIGTVLHKAFVWQFVSKAAAKKLKSAWAEVEDATLIKDKDWYRENQTGKKLVKDTDSYSVQCEVKNAPTPFSQEKFIDTVAKRYRIKKEELMAIAEASTAEGTKPVSFEILEAA